VFKKSLVARSGQAWKVGLLLFVELSAGLGMVVAFAGMSQPRPEPYALLMLACLALSLLALFAACWAIRCPQCGTRWLWRAVRGVAVPEIGFVLYGMSRCSKCEYSGDAM
jgi:hypothetical protein